MPDFQKPKQYSFLHPDISFFLVKTLSIPNYNTYLSYEQAFFPTVTTISYIPQIYTYASNLQRRSASGTGCLIYRPGFLLARRKMRWRKWGACLSEASCVPFSPPLAFFCKHRGTAWKSTAPGAGSWPARTSARLTQPLFS